MSRIDFKKMDGSQDYQTLSIGELNNSVCDLVDEMKKLLMEVNVARLNINDGVKELKEISRVKAACNGDLLRALEHIADEITEVK